MNIPTTGYRTTNDYEAAELYLKRAREMFDERRAQPRCDSAGRCD
jgi:hypothetical protein